MTEVARPGEAGGLHRRPPLTPTGVLLRHPLIVPLLAAAFIFLAVAAAVNQGSLLLTWDEPATRALIDARTSVLDGVVVALTDLGGFTIVTMLLVILLLLVWHECRGLALVLLAASVARPLLEWTLKSLVDRPRPELDQLVPGRGPSFPSGHVMAAIAIWGLLPPVVALVSGRRSSWWWSVALSATVIGVVSFSRVYLGVHWLSDVVGALILGSLYLLVVEWLLDRHHRRRPCRQLKAAFSAVEAGAPIRRVRPTDAA